MGQSVRVAVDLKPAKASVSFSERDPISPPKGREVGPGVVRLLFMDSFEHSLLQQTEVTNPFEEDTQPLEDPDGGEDGAKAVCLDTEKESTTMREASGEPVNPSAGTGDATLVCKKRARDPA